VVIAAGDRARGRIDGSAFPLRRSAEVLAEVVHLGYAETVLRRHGRARFVDAGCNILPGLVHRVVFDEERFAPAGEELHQPRVDAGKRCLDQRPLPVEDRLALVLKVEDFPHWPPLAKLLTEQVALCRVLGVSRFREDDRKAAAGEDPEEPPAGSVRPEVGGVQDAVAEVVPVAPHVVDPFPVQSPGIPADGLAPLVQIAPRHELLDVLDLDVVGVQRLDVAEQVFGQRAAVGVARKAAFGPREVRTLQRGPEDDEGIRILAAHPGRMGRERPQLQRTDVLRVVQRIGVVGSVRRDGVGVVVHARDHLGARISAVPRKVYPGRGAARTAEQVDVQKSDFIV